MSNSFKDGRLIGWKTIASYFLKDRSTVARWHRERGLPVHNFPGGKQRSVFAFEHELAEWALRQKDEGLNALALGQSAEDDTPAIPSVIDDDSGPLAPRAESPRPGRARGLPRNRKAIIASVAALVLAACILAALAAHHFWSRPDARAPLPRSPSATAKYVAAREAWGRRTGTDLANAIRLFEEVIMEEPDFAPARAGLAEAWLIIREYGDVPEARAFAAAKIAAQRAIALDPLLPGGHRALGFVLYWWENDPLGAIRSFNRALELDEHDGQTHFWFANALADMGEADAAERHYTRARLLLPGSRPVEVEYACAQWQAGRDAIALRLLNGLKRRYPSDPTINNCLTWVHISLGDMDGAARAYQDLAALRGEPNLTALARRLRQAIDIDPASAHHVLIERSRRELEQGTRRIRLEPAFYASAMGDRAELLNLMREAAVLGETWHAPPVTRRIAARWADDAEIMDLLRQLRAHAPVIRL